ncbi:hypothetical protein SY89_02014 [Halolamina pelagica]|uniref:Winged helix domain-containing protein n=1 Tax=Halolamina pelagica TaxID=699431 RepID=A0A0P7GR92_9EURY|nr:hypothetical protein [Halolamina pelagica]KPN31271.1 hypothetical protein SY89_02014 [Halolamina pelagica]
MTDDTDHDGHAADDRAVSLPLIDSFAALEAELDAKADRIERLEAELDRRYLDPDEHARAGNDAAERTGDATDDTDPRSPGDWEPATDPLEQTEGTTANDGRDRASPTRESTAADDSGLAPVRTACSKQGDPPAVEPTLDPDEPTGVTMEAGSDLTGGSLGSTTDALSARITQPESGSETGASDDAEADAADSTSGTARPDPTADRGERLSRLVRRAERRDADAVIDAFVEGIEALDDVTRAMLAHYRAVGDAAPVDAHVAAGGRASASTPTRATARSGRRA